MIDNMYGYNDYNGPVKSPNTNSDHMKEQQEENDDDEESNPLRLGMWQEGDSLAPPCGSSISVIHSIIELAFESKPAVDTIDGDLCSSSSSYVSHPHTSIQNIHDHGEVLYDLGCGDGRVCLEAYYKFYYESEKKNHSSNISSNCKSNDPVATENNDALSSSFKCIGIEIEEDLIQRFKHLISELPPLPSNHVYDKSDKDHSRIMAVQGDLCNILNFLLMDLQRKVEQTSVDSPADDSQKIQKPSPSCNLDYSYLPQPTIISLYLLPDSIKMIQDYLIKMMKLNPRLRIICNTWGLGKEYTPEKVIHAIDEESGNGTSLFLYTYRSITST